MLKSLSIVAASTLAAAPAFAGSDTPAPVEPAVTQAAPFNSSTPNWTGFYGGVQLGYANVDGSGLGDDDGFIGGLIAGYDYDLGDWVIGAGIDYDFTDTEVGNSGVNVEEVFRLKARGGYKIDRGLLYATAGYANADTNSLGSDDGYFLGGGYEYLISDQFSVGGELLWHDFDNYNSSGVDVEATTLQVRGTFRF